MPFAAAIATPDRTTSMVKRAIRLKVCAVTELGIALDVATESPISNGCKRMKRQSAAKAGGLCRLPICQRFPTSCHSPAVSYKYLPGYDDMIRVLPAHIAREGFPPGDQLRE